MKVLDLQCEEGHVFEGWFGSEQDFASQLESHLISCPVCSSTDIHKRLSAPRLNFGRGKPEQSSGVVAAQAHPIAAIPPEVAGEAGVSQLQAAWLSAARRLMASSEDVGGQFAQEARKMHYGDVPERAIRGQATLHEAAELLDEGIAVIPLPLPDALKSSLH
ncbi:MAG: hypothetical protein RLZZ591_1878 [Pseudomonadota bacterium]|jgi:hypothetical protein